MLPLRHTRRWQVAGVLVLLGVFLIALMPAMWSWPRGAMRVVFGADKWLHAATFLVLAVWFSGQYARHAYWRIALALLAFGIVIELCQRMVTYRTGDLLDLAANAAGIALGLLVAVAGAGGWSMRVENWWLRRGQRA